MSMEFSGKTVVVTGASRGIGRAIALAFGAVGARVACVATTLGNAEGTATLIREAGGEADAYGCDVSNAEAVDALFSQVGAPSVLVNNAGITRDTLTMRMKDEDWDAVMAVNLKGAFLCSRAAMRPMMKARWGRIINVSSVIGLHGAAGQANYAASKAGLIGLTMSLARELGSRGITVNAVAPGFIETDMTHGLTDDFRAKAVDNCPLGRLGKPEDVAAPVLFLAGEGASFITGQVLTVDGGLFL